MLARPRSWRGEQPPLSSLWIDDALAGLPEADRPAGRLALLTALAPYRVDARVIDEFRAHAPGGDEALIEVTGWASFVAARRVGEWIWVGPAHRRACETMPYLPRDTAS